MTELSRRELLRLFLGAPALASCRVGRNRPLPPGELLGASANLGHHIRTPGAPPTPSEWRNVEIVIVGAGVAGLAAADRLARAGVNDVVIVELEAAIGGTSRSGRSSVTGYPWGAHYVPAPLKENRALGRILREIGAIDGVDASGDPTIAEEFRCRDPEERIFYRGRWFEGLYLHAGASPEDRRQWSLFTHEIERWVAFRDARGRRAFVNPISRCSDDAEVTALDKLSIANWLDERGLSSERLRWLIDYACRDDYGTRLENTSAWAALFYFAARLSKPGAESRPLVVFPEGNGRLVTHLNQQLGGRTRLNELVVDIRHAGDFIEVRTSGSTGLRARQVVFAAHQRFAPYVIADYREHRPAHVDAFDYGAWMVANLHLTAPPAENRGFPLAWDNVLRDSPSLGYVVATHQSDQTSSQTVFTYYYPLCDLDARAARRRLLDTDRDTWAEIALSDLERAHPDLRPLVERLDVMRWGHAMVRPRPGFIWSGDRQRAAQPYRNIFFAHSDLSGIALFEEALDQGYRAAEEILAARGQKADSLR